MIKEFAFGLSNRHHFQEAEHAGDWVGTDKDTFTSLYDYDEYVVEYFSKHQTLSGFDGLIYMPDEFILDVDGPETTKAKDRTIGLLILLKDLDIPYNLYFSGRGFHVGIPSTAFRWKPDAELHLKVKDSLTNAGIFEYADPSVTDKTRLIRLVNTRNTKSGFWKVQITEDMLHKEVEDILKYANYSKKLIDNVLECDPVFDVLIRNKKKEEIAVQHNLGNSPDPVNHTCIQRMLEGAAYGKRHMIALRIAAHLRWRYPEEVVKLIMEDWRMRVSTDSNVFSKNEMESIVKNCYEGHGGQGYRYGCNDAVMDSYCSTTCKLYKSKKSQNVMDAESMEKSLIDFYTNNVEPVNLGALYGQDFPIYPGEVIILQAPPASMKTMLLQNWMNAFKKTTYFLEMEMSPRQIWSRFVMIENGWSEEELANHYKQLRNGMEDKFKWLTVDYSSPYSTELEKRITTLPRKPEIMVVDHMGLFKSKQRDNNMKVEEVSQSLMEVAVKHNIIVFAVSEITKQAFHEGINMASSRGSFRIAYNANKLLSITPYKNKETGLIEMLQLKCDKNRERENLNVQLNVNNVRIGV
jgi:hypothetical protein